MANSKEPYILLSLYQNLYKEKYGKIPSMNKFRSKWAMQDVIDSVGYERASEIMQYYFRLDKSGHALEFFFYNFDRMDDMMNKIAKDKQSRKILLEETKKMVEEGGIK